MDISNESVTVNFWLDKDEKRKRIDGTFPVKIIVYSKYHKKNKRYKSPFYLTVDDFESVYLTSKPRSNWKSYRNQMDAHRNAILAIAKSIDPFTFELFEKKIGRESRKLTASGISDYLTDELESIFRPDDFRRALRSPVVKGYDEYIDSLRTNDQFRTASGYLLSLKSIFGFFVKRQKASTPFDFDSFTIDFMKAYQKSMINDGYTLSTVGIYVRNLRTIYLRAIKAGIAEMKLFPFGKDRYQIPNARRVNHPLVINEIQMLIDADPESEHQAKARDYFLFSYYGGGMNMADILQLKWSDMKSDTISFYRQKTKSINQDNLTPILIHLDDLTKDIIHRHGNDRKGSDDYIFPILNRLDEYISKGKSKIEWRDDLIKNHTRYVNQNLKKLIKAIGIESDIYSKKARYSFADHMRNADVPIDVRMSMMGHGNEKTHRTYLSTIPAEKQREAASKALAKSKKESR